MPLPWLDASRAVMCDDGATTLMAFPTATTMAAAAPRRSLPHTIGWNGMVVLAAFNLFAVASDLAADSGTACLPITAAPSPG